MYKKIFNGKNATHDEWLEARKQGIGGSDMAAILGFNKYRDAVSVWLDKRENCHQSKKTNQCIGETYLRKWSPRSFRKGLGGKSETIITPFNQRNILTYWPTLIVRSLASMRG